MRRTTSTSTCTDAKIKDEILHYLKGASDRDGGRHTRRQVAAADAAAASADDDDNNNDNNNDDTGGDVVDDVHQES